MRHLLRRNPGPQPIALHIGEHIQLQPGARSIPTPAGEFDYTVTATCPDADFNLVAHAEYNDGLVEIIGSDARNRQHASSRVARNGAIEHVAYDDRSDGEHEERFCIRVKPGITRIAVVLETTRQFGDLSRHLYTTDIVAGEHVIQREPHRRHLRITTDGSTPGPNKVCFVAAIIHVGTPTINLEVPGQPAPNPLPLMLQPRELAFSTS
jgi:hypothetical protein